MPNYACPAISSKQLGGRLDVLTEGILEKLKLRGGGVSGQCSAKALELRWCFGKRREYQWRDWWPRLGA